MTNLSNEITTNGNKTMVFGSQAAGLFQKLWPRSLNLFDVHN